MSNTLSKRENRIMFLEILKNWYTKTSFKDFYTKKLNKIKINKLNLLIIVYLN